MIGIVGQRERAVAWIPFDDPGYELRDGKVISVTLGYAMAAAALEAVGLRE